MPTGDQPVAHLGWRAVGGAALGAVIGFVVGLIVHKIMRDGGSAVGFELTGAFLGSIAGVSLGAFYGGASSLSRHRHDRHDP